MNQATLQNTIYAGSVESRLAFGLLLFKKFGKTLAEHAGVHAALVHMGNQESVLAAHMQDLALGRLCSSCATSDGGGCCSRFMAGETDSLQILINLMAGVDVAQINNNPAECCYLSAATGCIFTFKPMFCLNYNCHRIKIHANGSGMRRLERLAAVLLGSQYQLEMLLLNFLKTHDSLQGNPLALPAKE